MLATTLHTPSLLLSHHFVQGKVRTSLQLTPALSLQKSEEESVSFQM